MTLTPTSTHSEFQEKMDTLDMIINILKDHEENLSKISDRLDTICSDLSSFEERISTLDQTLGRLDGLKVKNVVGAVGLKGPLVTIECKDWVTFRNVSQGGLFAAFEVLDDMFSVSSVSDLFIFTFRDRLIEIEMLMENDMRKSFKFSLRDETREIESLKDEELFQEIFNPKTAKRWLSSELGIPEEKVVEGRILR